MRILRACGTVAGVLVALSAIAVTGCGKKITVYRRPTFWTPELKSIAMVPFRSVANNPNAGVIMSDQLASLLATNAAYKRVFNRSDYKHIVDEKRLMSSMADSPSAMAPFRKWGKAQAVIVGVVTQYAATTRNERKRVPIQKYNPRTKQTYIAGYNTYTHTRNEANVGVNATMIRVADGQPIYSTGPVYGRSASESGYGGSAPGMDPHACLMAATNQAVRQLLTHFGIVRMEIKVNPGKDFLIAKGPQYDGKWPTTDTFRSGDDKMYVMLRLPPACDRNPFRMTIIRKGTQKELATTNFLWDRKYSAHGQTFMFSPRKIASIGGGPGEYELKFYASPEPSMIKGFKIVP